MWIATVWRGLACLLLASIAGTASAQIQRTFVNLGFEEPDSGTASCFIRPADDQVPGWTTTHGATTAGGSCAGFPYSPGFGRVIEIWTNGFNGVTSRSGTQHAELNAFENSRIYQQICLTNGESVSWVLSHRGRDSATSPDVMDFGVNVQGSTTTPVTTLIARIGTTNNGTDRIDGSGTPSSASLGSLTIGGTTNGWRDYSGTFTWSGPTAVQQFGFAAFSSGNGDLTGGNFLDDIQVTLRPYIELVSGSSTVREGGTAPTVQLRIMGTVPTGGITVPFTVTGGTANASDYTLGGSVSIAAGTYDNQLYTLPITINNDTVIEDNETMVVTLTATPASYTLTSTNTCGGAATVSHTILILDNDVDLRTTVSVSNVNPPHRGTTTFTVTFQNNTARPTVGSGTDLEAHDAPALQLNSPLSSGFSTFSWTCAASGTPLPTCPTASGSGTVSETGTLPAGNGGAAGGVLTYTIVATMESGFCGTVTNRSSVTANSPVTEGTSAQAGFTTPVPGGTANNTVDQAVDPGCLTLTKTVTPAAAAGPFNFTLTNTSATTGTATTPAGGSVQVDGNTLPPAPEPFGIATVGTAVTINENALPAGYYLANATCTGPSGAVGTLSGATLTIPAAGVTAGADFTCTFTNGATGTITIVKDVVPDHAQDFAFTTTGSGLSNFSLDDDADGTLSNTRTFAGLVPGTYSVTETATPGWSLTNLACSDPDSGTTTNLGTRAASIDVDSAETITCTYTNTSTVADLSITITNTPGFGASDQAADTLTRGQATTYSIVVGNGGPAPSTGAVVRNTMSNLNCPAANTVTCTGAGTCPGATVATLTGTGVVLPTLASGSAITLTYGCTVP